MTARAEGQGRAEKLATAILVMMTSTYTYEQLTNTLTHALAEAVAQERERCAVVAQAMADKLYCDSLQYSLRHCRGLQVIERFSVDEQQEKLKHLKYSSELMGGHIHLVAIAQAIRQSSERMTLSRSGVKQPHGAGEE